LIFVYYLSRKVVILGFKALHYHAAIKGLSIFVTL